MIRGLYTAVSGMIAQENKQNVITNNLANSNTTGYKSSDLVVKNFKEVLLYNNDKIVNGKNVRQDLGTLSLGVSLDDSFTNQTQGLLEDTGKETDFGLAGSGFFTVERTDGVSSKNYYTRDGHFHINGQGLLVNDAGDYVLGNNGQRINVGNGKLKSDIYGNITITDQNKNTSKISLDVVDFNDYKKLERVGDNLYSGKDPQNSSSKITQGSLEKSNVNVTNEMINMMTVMRSFESDQKLVQTIDETLGKAVNTVGSARG